MKVKKNTSKGFTLVEMAIVLVIIGLIISAVSISQNLQRNADLQKIKQKFVDQWVSSYNQYYNRTGVVVGDSQSEPRFMVSGADYVYDDAAGNPGAGIPGGSIDIATPYRVCEGESYEDDVIESHGYTVSNQSLHDLMDKHGIRMPPGRGEGKEDRYVYLDSNGNPQELQVCFQWNPASLVHGSGNTMLLRGLTPELAREVDRMIDGKADASEGMFRQYDNSTNTEGTNGVAGTEWLGNNTYTQGSTTPQLNGVGTNLDEDRIVLVTAVYKMDQ
jgi:prepilin-type N-terminal cleavage/methylation domain-containing protein